MAQELATNQEGAMPDDESMVAKEAEKEERGLGSFFTPEAVAMLSLAAVVDGGEFLLELIPFAGQILSVILDIVALVFIGGWMYFRSGTTESKRKAEQAKRRAEMIKKGVEMAKKGAKMAKASSKWIKWLKYSSVVFEVVGVVVSSFLPLWLLAVILELKYGGR